MLLIVVAMVVLALLTGVVLKDTASSQAESRSSRASERALNSCEAGISHALGNIAIGLIEPIASFDSPLMFGGGGYSVTVVDNGDDTFSLRAVGVYDGEARAVEVVARTAQDGPFANALFAGNAARDPNYTLKFGGVAGEADEIRGAVYSGQDVMIDGDVSIQGAIRAAGVISGDAGEEGVNQVIPNIAAMQYAKNNDVDVLREFREHATRRFSALGGAAYQVPEWNPAHVFRANPSDRGVENASTRKCDFYLEDPYESVKPDPREDGSDASKITLSGRDVPGVDGGGLVYFIDGNLWIHNHRTNSFELGQSDAPEGVQATFVVRGNVYLQANVFYRDPSKDAVAFVAIRDPAVPDSGNIYLGGPGSESPRSLSAYFYAENDFYDTNPDARGSKSVTINGTMSAGHRVVIDRDRLARHSKLKVHFDDRAWSGAIRLPGLPDQSGGEQGVTILSWNEVPVSAAP